jgi:hypothetical protein
MKEILKRAYEDMYGAGEEGDTFIISPGTYQHILSVVIPNAISEGADPVAVAEMKAACEAVKRQCAALEIEVNANLAAIKEKEKEADKARIAHEARYYERLIGEIGNAGGGPRNGW